MLCQRWRRRRELWRPPEECINPRVYEVALVRKQEARTFVETHHYSGSYVASRLQLGLFRRNRLVGVAAFSQPVNDKTLAVFGEAPAVELGRFVLLDPEPANSESWFMARCFRELRRLSYEGVVSFSDPTPRYTEAGEIIHPGHVGTIYQAANAIYVGRSTSRTLRLLPDGRVLNARSIQKIRKFEDGWPEAAAALERLGAPPLTERVDPYTWLRMWLPRLTRPLRHPGNHKYLFGLSRAVTRMLPKSLGYPKLRLQ